MAQYRIRHLNLQSMALKMAAAGAAAALVPDAYTMTQPDYLAAVAEKLRQQRIAMTDDEFRRRYAYYIAGR